MTFSTARFGEIEYDNKDVVVFSEGLVGFPQYTRFLILDHKEGSLFHWLQCLDEPALAFLVVEPGRVFSGYDPEISDAQAASLALQPSTETIVLAIVTIPRGQPQLMTANLAGPLVINAETRLGRQMVLDDERYWVKQPIFSENAAPVAA